jgi:hypothetical protein
MHPGSPCSEGIRIHTPNFRPATTSSISLNVKGGLEALLTPDNGVLVLIDHQPFQLANVDSHEPTMIMNNVTGLAKTAKAYVYIVTDASGGVSVEAHDMGIRRLVAAGAQPITWLGMAGELQRDWARTPYLPDVAKIFADHGGATGSVLAWEMRLLRRAKSKALRPHIGRRTMNAKTQVQWQNIYGNDLAQFRGARTQPVVSPAILVCGNVPRL